MLRIFVTFLLLIALAVGGWIWWAVYAPIVPQASTAILLHSGYSPRRIAAELHKAGVIRSELAFRLWHRLHPQPRLKAGEYLFEREASLLVQLNHPGHPNIPEIYDYFSDAGSNYLVMKYIEGQSLKEVL